MERDATDTLKRARQLKSYALQNISILQYAPTQSPSPCSTTASLEDELIQTLRAEHKPWADITAQLNEHRLYNNEAPTLTEDAVYSRFILSSAATATPAREIGFEPRDYAHLRNAGSGREGSSKAGKKRIKDFQNATELSANIRKPVLLADADGAHVQSRVDEQGKGKGKAKGKNSEEKRRKGEGDEIVRVDENLVEVLMRAVAKVDRNFWVFVADEVEREGGKYIEPKELEKVFHEI